MDRQESSKLLGEYIDYLLEGSDADNPLWNQELILSGRPNRWNYIDGCMIIAVLELYKMSGEKRYLEFADSFIGSFVNEDGSIRTYSPEEYNIDNINAGKTLFRLYEYTGREKYRKAIDTVYSQLKTMPRTKEGNFWHKNIYPNQVWLDGLYMAQPFFMEYETKFNKMKLCLDSFAQFENVERLMKDSGKGLYYHGYDESRKMYWANPETGLSRCFWLRAIGWFMAALADTADAMDESLYYEYRRLQEMLKNLAEALIVWQQSDGMFLQLPDRPELEGNYPETSGTALIAYAMLKGVRLGYLPERFAGYAVKAFDGICGRYLERGEGSRVRLGGICLVAGLGGEKRRDGSPEYYLSEPVVENEAKGIAPLILAYTELLRRGESWTLK